MKNISKSKTFKTKRFKYILQMRNELKNITLVVIPTDKTNLYQTFKVNKYISCAIGQMWP